MVEAKYIHYTIKHTPPIYALFVVDIISSLAATAHCFFYQPEQLGLSFSFWNSIMVPLFGTQGIPLRIIAKSRLKDYWETTGNEQSKSHLTEWYHFCLEQDWKTPQDIKNTLSHASIVKNNRVIFNVNGNHYRIICSIFYPAQIMYIKFVGTHTEYDQINVNIIE